MANILLTVYDNISKYDENFNKKYYMKEILFAVLFQLPFKREVIFSNKAIIDKEHFLEVFAKNNVDVKIKEISSILFSTKQTLVHGDLHLGSICNRGTNFKLYDFEFSFIGPIGYDIGKVLAHLILAYFYQRLNNMVDSCITIENEIKDFFNCFTDKCDKSRKSSIFSIKNDITTHICMFCGIELISRITGVLQLQYILGIESLEYRNIVQKYVVDIAIDLIQKASYIKDGEEVVDYVRKFKCV